MEQGTPLNIGLKCVIFRFPEEFNSHEGKSTNLLTFLDLESVEIESDSQFQFKKLKLNV